MAYKVLLVSPDEKRAEKVRHALHSMGQIYRVLHAPNQAQGIAWSVRENPDLLLFDWIIERRLPGSFDNLRTAVSASQIPIIAIASDHELEEVYDSGATDYVSSAMNPIEISFRVKSALTMHRLHIGVLEQNRTLEDQSNTLRVEMDKSEKLLKSILPEEIAEQLKNKGRVEPKTYKMVSIMFTDFKGFTRISEILSAEEIMSALDHLFGVYDEITSKNYLEKLKTIGDAYMCAGGLPLRNRSNPINAVLAALEIQYFMRDYNLSQEQAKLPRWDLRIGIHTGKVIAGVIGKKKFAYDIWGDTVNTAARMESSGESGQVNISGTTYQYIKEFFDCTYRGKISAKNKGEIDMYFVDGIKPEFSLDNQYVFPNQEFMKRISEI